MQIKTFFDFCSGVGGGRQGLEWAGLKCVGSSDTSFLSNRTYELLFNCKKDSQFGNIRKLIGKKLPVFDVMIAGFPCQSFSVIGRQTGTADKRGQIIYNLIDLIYENQPKVIILENVKGLITHDKGKTFQDIINRIEEAGYEVDYKVLNSMDYGVPHMRQRVYIVAFASSLGLNLANFRWPAQRAHVPLRRFLNPSDNKMSTEDYTWFTERYLFNDENNGKYNLDEILSHQYLIVDTRMSDLRLYTNKVPTLRAHRDGIYYVYNRELYYLTGAEALRLQGFTYHRIKRVKDIVSNRHLLKQAGNAMTTTVIKELGMAIKAFVEQGDY